MLGTRRPRAHVPPRDAVVPDLRRHAVDQRPDLRAAVDQGRDDELAALEDRLELVVLDPASPGPAGRGRGRVGRPR